MAGELEKTHMGTRIGHARAQMMIFVRDMYEGRPLEDLISFGENCNNLTVEILEHIERDGKPWITQVRFSYYEGQETKYLVFSIRQKGIVAWAFSDDPTMAHTGYYAEETLYQINTMSIRLAKALNRLDGIKRLMRYQRHSYSAWQRARFEDGE